MAYQEVMEWHLLPLSAASGSQCWLSILQNRKTYFFCSSTWSLTVSAILININSLIVIFVLLIALIIYRGEGKRTKTITIILFLGLLPILLAVRFLLDLNKAGSLNYGGNIGFWTTSVKDLTNMLFGSGASFVNIYIIILLIFFGSSNHPPVLQKMVGGLYI